jgi:26S proteasome regulatory subunit N2
VENFQARDASEVKPIDPRLEDIVNRMFQRCFEDKKFKQAIGIAIETRRLDVFEKAILTSVGSNFIFLFYFVTIFSRLEFKKSKFLFLIQFGENKSNPIFSIIANTIVLALIGLFFQKLSAIEF